MGKERVHLRLSYEVVRSLEEAALPRRVTKSAIVEEALRLYFDPELTESRETVLLRRLDGFDLRQGTLERDTALIAETLGQFVLYWLTRTDPLPDGERDVAHRLGQKRFDYFINQVAQKLGSQEAIAAKLFAPIDDERSEDDA